MSRARSGPSSVDRVTGVSPDDREWRADALARSTHSRLDEVLIEPRADHDLDRATAVCAEVTRRALQDFAPALLLLPASQRRRVQAVAAFGLTLFDFARQSSLEGEKLAQINRWCFDLELTFEGDPPGQPVFVLLAAADDERPWPRQALDALAGCARRRALHRRADSVAAVERDALVLAQALIDALVPEADTRLTPIVAALLRVQRLLALGDDRRRHLAGLATAELPERWSAAGAPDRRSLAASLRRECARLIEALAAFESPAPLPRDWVPRNWRRALRYSVLAAHRLVVRIDRSGADALESPPRLGVGERLWLLLRSRWLPS